MNKIKIFSSILLIGLLSGCAQKSENVAYDNIKEKQPSSTVKLNTTHYLDNSENIDKKVAQIQVKDTSIDENVEVTVDVIPKDPNINEVVSVIDGKKIVLRSIHFRFDQYKLTPKMTTIASDNSIKINSVYSSNGDVKVKLEGNCDEWRTDEYNYALGLKRTKTVKNALIKDGVPSDKIVVVSFGESNPLCTEQTASCWKKNRRVDYKLLP
jgi:peptidoglycan-associated lipoprotein